MADGFDDDVFVLQNGIITNQNVPLILEHDLGDNDELGEPHPEFNDDDQVMEEVAEGGNQQGALQNEPEALDENGNFAQIGFQVLVQGEHVGLYGNVPQNGFEVALQGGPVGFDVNGNIVQNGFLAALQGEPEGLDENGNVAQNGFQVALQGELEASQGSDNVAQNGFHGSAQSVSSAISSIAFEQGEFLGASSPTPNRALTGYVNEGYQSDLSELSELSASVEANTLAPSFREPSHRLTSITEVRSREIGIQVPDPSTSSHENGQLSVVRNTPTNGTDGLPEARNKLQVMSSSSHDNSERIYPNPPNSPVFPRGHLFSPQYRRRYREANRQVQFPSNPNIPYKMFVKFGTFLLILVFLFLLAIVACLQDILPDSHLTAFLVLLILSLAGAIGCYIKACCVAQEQTEETPTQNYGSTTQTRPGSSGNTRPGPSNAE